MNAVGGWLGKARLTCQIDDTDSSAQLLRRIRRSGLASVATFGAAFLSCAFALPAVSAAQATPRLAPATGPQRRGVFRSGPPLLSVILMVMLGFVAVNPSIVPGSRSNYRIHATPTDYNYGQGYWEVGSDGGIYNFGVAQFDGSMGGTILNAPMVGMSPTSDGLGYWEVASDGGIFAWGDGLFYGSMGGQHLNKPMVGVTSTVDAKGYWEVASDGGIFSWGDAVFYGSMGGQTLNAPIVAMAATPDGLGYWEVGSDGGIYNFGDAAFYGSTGGQSLNKPIMGMAATPDGHGYWLVGGDGGVFNFGDASLYSSLPNTTLPNPIVGIAASPSGAGYWLAGSDGAIVDYGDAQNVGGQNAFTINAPIVGVSSAANRSPISNTGYLAKDLAVNGGFNNGMEDWTAEANTAYAIYGAGQVAGESPYEGTGFQAIGSTNGGGANSGIYQNVAISINTGDTYCVSAEMSSQGTSNNATGALALFMLGGASGQDGSSINYGPLLGSNVWVPIQTCVTATQPRTELQVQYYLGAGNTTTDAVNLTRDLAIDGGFNNGMEDWTAEANTAYANYGVGQVTGENPYEGSGFEAIGSSSGGGIYQVIPIVINTGDTYCASAEVSSQGTSSGATGVLVLFMLGGSGQEASDVSYGPLAGSNVWKSIQTCVTATEPHTELQIQYYLGAGITTTDAVDVTRDLGTNGGFNIGYGTRGWSLYGSTNAVVYGSGQVAGESPYEGSGFVAMNSTNNSGIYQDIPVTISPGDTYCVSAELSTQGTATGAYGSLDLFMLGGSGQDGSSKAYVALPGSNSWTPVQTCVTATSARTELQIQFYLSGGTTTADAVEVG